MNKPDSRKEIWGIAVSNITALFTNIIDSIWPDTSYFTNNDWPDNMNSGHHKNTTESINEMLELHSPKFITSFVEHIENEIKYGTSGITCTNLVGWYENIDFLLRMSDTHECIFKIVAWDHDSTRAIPVGRIQDLLNTLLSKLNNKEFVPPKTTDCKYKTTKQSQDKELTHCRADNSNEEQEP